MIIMPDKIWNVIIIPDKIWNVITISGEGVTRGNDTRGSWGSKQGGGKRMAAPAGQRAPL